MCAAFLTNLSVVCLYSHSLSIILTLPLQTVAKSMSKNYMHNNNSTILFLFVWLWGKPVVCSVGIQIGRGRELDAFMNISNSWQKMCRSVALFSYVYMCVCLRCTLTPNTRHTHTHVLSSDIWVKIAIAAALVQFFNGFRYFYRFFLIFSLLFLLLVIVVLFLLFHSLCFSPSYSIILTHTFLNSAW